MAATVEVDKTYDPPSGLNSPVQTPTSVTLSWRTVGTSVSYRVWQSKNSDMSDGVFTDTHTGNKREIRGLIPATTYYFRVRVIAADGTSLSPYSPPASFKTNISPPAPPPMTSPLRMASYNVKCADYCLGGLSWEQRRTAVVSTIIGQKPDVIGFQEAAQTWLKSETRPNGLAQFEDLQQRLQAAGMPYRLASSMRNNCVLSSNPGKCVYKNQGASKGTKIMFNSDNIDFVSSGSLLLPNSTTADERYLAWAFLKQKKTGKTFIFADTHLNQNASSSGSTARLNQTKAIVVQLTKLNTKNLPVVIVGDMNSNNFTTPTNIPYDVLTAAGYVDPLGNTYREVLPSSDATVEKRIRANYNSYNGLALKAPSRAANENGSYVDYIFTSKMRVGAWETVVNIDANGQFRGVIPSDHNMIRADVQLP
ncbi:endonuclease/exonuclease/phosphatase family protein [Arthrobacter psychrochitiniphilus]|nr:endonuclease/exonuclease/phosphatase family protein [Arthrobacter psychrochitiniphilus]